MCVGARRAALIAAIVFGAALTPSAVFFETTRGGLPPPSPPALLPHRASVSPSRPHPQPHAPPRPQGDDRFLVLGLTQDNRRTDTIEVVQWDEARHRARLLGVPRDIDISLPGIGPTKLVHAYATGGIGRARAAITRLLNVPIAHYVVFSLPAMRRVVDLIGGVAIDVEERMVYTDRRQNLVIDLYPGPQVLSGEQAEQYLRFRHDAAGDIGRIRRQQHFLRAALAQVRQRPVLLRLPEIIQIAREYVQTDLTSSEILGWMRRVEPLTPDAVSSASIDGTPAVLYDALARASLDFWIPNRNDLHAKVRWLVTGAAGPARQPDGY
jgi:LCP family protein required for cell wall assembly